jgi:hypothetical protein
MPLYVVRVVQLFGVLYEVKQNALYAHRIRLSVTQYLRLYRLLDFHEIQYRSLHENWSSKLEFRENWHGGSHTSPKGVNESVPYFRYFVTDFDEGQCKEIST